MTRTVNCPKCGEELDIEPHEVNKATCEECGEKFNLDSVHIVESQHSDDKKIETYNYKTLYYLGRTISIIGWITLISAILDGFSRQ